MDLNQQLTKRQKDDLESIVDDAQYDFWQRVAKRCPAAVTGDLPPDIQAPFNEACMKAVEYWMKINGGFGDASAK